MAFIVHFVAALCLIHLSNGQECRHLRSVYDSTAGVLQNVIDGGHLWQHINGLPKKPDGAEPGDTQYHKTLFEPGYYFNNAFTAFRGLPGVYSTCPNGGGANRVDHVHAYSIGVTQGHARYCTAVNNQDICTNSHAYGVTNNHYVTFCYRYYNNKWIMRTAYPRYYDGHPVSEQTLADSCEQSLTEYENEEDDVTSEYKNLIQLLIDWILDRKPESDQK